MSKLKEAIARGEKANEERKAAEALKLKQQHEANNAQWDKWFEESMIPIIEEITASGNRYKRIDSAAEAEACKRAGLEVEFIDPDRVYSAAYWLVSW